MKKEIIVLAIAATAAAGWFGYTKAEERKALELAQIRRHEVTSVSENELQKDLFYIKSGDQFLEPYLGNTSGDLSKKQNAEDRIITYTDDIEKIPTVFKGETLVYKSDTPLKKLSWERFKDEGWTFGVYHLEKTENEKVLFSKKKTKIEPNCNAVNGFGNIQLPSGSDGVIIDKINGTEITSDILNPIGIIPGFEKDETISMELYAGTTPYELETIADTRVFSSMERFTSEEFSLSKAGYAEIKIPDYFLSGYYSVNGIGLFRYVANERSDGIPEGNLSTPYYYKEGGKTYTYEEWNELHGTKTSEEGEPDFQYTIKTDTKKTVKLNITYDSKNDVSRSANGRVISPSGKETELKISGNKSSSEISEEITFDESGTWKIELYRTGGSNFKIETEFSELEASTENIIKKNLEAKESETKMLISWSNKDAAGTVSLISPTGTKLTKESNPELITKEENGLCEYTFTSIEGGEWIAEVEGENIGTVSFDIY